MRNTSSLYVNCANNTPLSIQSVKASNVKAQITLLAHYDFNYATFCCFVLSQNLNNFLP